MNKLTTFLTASIFSSFALIAQADDVRPEQVQQLTAAGTIKSLEGFNQAALAQHPQAQITDTDLDLEYGRYFYEVELRDAQGVEWDLEFDAVTGQLLQNRQDD